ncbi:MAG: type I glutamate--ammonia ligase [Candidatus Bipolaricaulia bacterium]
MPERDEQIQQVLKEIEARNVRFVRLQFIDILGIPKNVEIPADELEQVLQNDLAFDGSSIEGFARISESDMYLRPDPSTFAIYPWRVNALNQDGDGEGQHTARLICDVYTPQGEPFSGDPRYALRRAIAEAAQQGYAMYAGPEPEFFLLQKDEHGRPTLDVHDRGGYFDLMPIDLGEETRQDIVLALEEMGFNVEAAHHEVAPGQHEIDFRYTNALRTADNIVTFKLVTKTIALFRGLHATFMPKPVAGENGSGMHTHLSLFKDDINTFYDPSDEYNLSEVAYQFMAGLIAHIDAITALTSPTINSYKRLVPGYEAPVNISWARINRSALIRIPASNTPEVSTRLEFRSPDPSTNPYLAFAAILRSGLDGIARKLTPPSPVEEDIYEMTEEQRRKHQISVLPASLDQALEALENDEVIRGALGEHIFERFLAAKHEELLGYRTAVTQWEIDRYLDYY